jgi:hypothetical protein
MLDYREDDAGERIDLGKQVFEVFQSTLSKFLHQDLDQNILSPARK